MSDPAVSLAPAWEAKFDLMTGLRKGWNGYEADPPSPRALALARQFVRLLHAAGIPPTRVAPSTVGGVGITRAVGHRRVYVEFYNDGTAHAMLAQGEDATTFPVVATADGYRAAIVQAEAYLNG